MSAGVSAATPVVLTRPSLEARLDDAFGRRLTLVVAGAGYGKSTLVGQWGRELVTAWYAASPRDRRLSSFAAGIVEAVRPHVGGLSEELAAALAGGDGLESAEAVAAHLCAALESSLTHDLIVVLDDVHELADAPACLRLVESLSRQAPATVHVVLASREELGLRVDRLRAQGQVLELTASELAFTPDEVAELAAPLLGDDDDLAPEIHRVTGGWPAAVRLAVEAVAAISAPERARALERLRLPGGALFSFLAHEVFEREPPEVHELLRTVAPLESFTVELCDALGLARAEDVVAQLTRRGLFVREQDETLTLHALVREFARSAWPLAPEEERTVHLRAAAWFESTERYAEALATLAAASEHVEVVRLLEDRGLTLLSSGRSQLIVQVAGDLPSDARTAAVEQLAGEALLMRAEFTPAIEALERAAAKADRIDSALGWRLGSAYHFRGDLDRALDAYARVESSGADADDALLLAWSAGTHAMSDRLDDAERIAPQAMEAASRSGDDRALAAAHVGMALSTIRQGWTHAEDQHLELALAAAERCGDRVMLARVRTNRAAGLTERGFYRAALEEVDQAIAVAEGLGLTFERTLTNRGGARLRLGLLDEAAADYAAVVEFSRKRDSAEAGIGLIGLGDVHRERGNLELARTAYEQGLDLTERRLNPDLVAPAHCGLARVLVDEAPDHALELAERALHVRWAYPSFSSATVGWLALAGGDRASAGGAAVEAARRARERGDRWGLAEALELEVFASEEPAGRIDRLEEALTLWRDMESRVRIAECELAVSTLTPGAEAQAARDRAERKLRVLGVRVSASGPAGLLRTVAPVGPAPVAVQALGGFAVLRDGVPVPVSAWQTRKSRELLKMLVCRRGRQTPREVVMEALWPGEEPSKLGNRLSVALSTLRAVLDPERRYPAEHFVSADRDSIAIDLKTVLVDVEVFLHEAETGLSLRVGGDSGEAAEWLEQAESVYAGDVLEGDPYSDWAVSLREAARAAYISVAHALAHGAAHAGDEDLALRYYLRVLERDPYDEGAHLGRVSTLERAGRRGEARRAYRTYVARTEELGVTPSIFPQARGLKEA